MRMSKILLLMWAHGFWLLIHSSVHALRKSKLTWVNGIGYNLEHMKANKKEISAIFGGKRVEFCHNPTAMVNEEDIKGYMADFANAGTQKLGYTTEEVESLVKHLKDAVANVGRRGRVIHIAHSQGALITHLAAKQLTPLELSQIEVISFGGAAVLQKTTTTPFRRCINYYATNDPLLLIVPAACQALRSGFLFSNEQEEEFCFLVPRDGDPLVDHNLLGPTYLEALSWEGYRFQRIYQSLPYKFCRSQFLLFLKLKRAFLVHSQLLWMVVAKKIIEPMMTFALLFWMFFKKQAIACDQFIKMKIMLPLARFFVAFFHFLEEVTLRVFKGEVQEKYEPVPQSALSIKQDPKEK